MVLRVASRAFGTLAPLRADHLPALAAWHAAEREAQRARDEIGGQLFAQAGPPDAARPERPALLALRRA
ncbi:MAG TPA: hypothetical protein VFK69_01605, partial [Candidatus Eisenbacteria bacterium]|nr:hypothetical protein [Candidatus Eisenbacteria bacterium]